MSHWYKIKGLPDSQLIAVEALEDLTEKFIPTENYLFWCAKANNRGVVERDLFQDYPKALLHFKDALRRIEVNSGQLAYRGTILKNIGKVYLDQLGDFSQAKLYLLESRKCYEAALLDTIYQEIDITFILIGIHKELAKLAIYQNNFPAARRYLDQMVYWLKAVKKKRPSSFYLESYLELCAFYLKIDELPKVAYYLEQAMKLTDLSRVQRAGIWEMEGRYFAAKGLIDRAIASIEESIQLTDKEQIVSLVKRKCLLTTLLMDSGKLMEAIALNKNTIDFVCGPELDGFSPQRLEGLTSPLVAFQVIQQKAKAHVLLADFEDRRNNLDLALETYRQLFALGNQMRINYQSQESKLFLNANAHTIYEEAIALAHQSFRETGENVYIDWALEFMESSKASILLEELMAKEAVGKSTIPDTLLQLGQQIKYQINYTKKAIAASESQEGESERGKNAQHYAKLLSLNRALENWRKTVNDNYPSYQQYLLPTSPDGKAIQAMIAEDEGGVSYFWGEENLYYIFYKPGKVIFQKLSNTAEVSELQYRLLSNLKLTGKSGVADFSNAAYALFELLLPAKALNSVSRLIVIPDGQLALLPFDLLLTQPSNLNEPRSLPYLLQKLSINYSFSWSVFQIRGSEKSSHLRCLHVAPVFAQRPERYLPESKELLFGAFGRVHQALLFNKATKTAFLEKLHNFDILHLATHAITNDTIFAEPAIELFDSSLHLRDLYGMDLPTELIVMSACEVGIGDLEPGEGIMSLARGFTFAGVPSIVSSLWKINEKSSNEILRGFYDNLASGLPKDKALQRAKINYLTNCSDFRAAPYYWASLTMIGDPSSMQRKDNGNLYYLIFLLTIVTFGMLFFRKKLGTNLS